MIYLVAFLAMTAQDFTLTLKSLAANRNHTLLAGLCDMVGGFCAIATITLGGATAVKHGLSWQTAGVFAALGAADFLGAGLGTKFGNKWIHQSNLQGVK